MKNILMSKSLLILITGWMLLISGCFLIDDSPLKSPDGNDIGKPRFASGPSYGNYFSYAEGMIDSAIETFGIFMENSTTEGTLDNAARLVSDEAFLGGAYMAMVQEDIFRYTKNTFESQFTVSPDSADKKYLKMASQIKVIMALYNEDVHLLVNKSSGINSVTDINTGHIVNLGSPGSGTYITSTTIMNAHSLGYTAKNDDAAAGIAKVVEGTYDAAFYVTASPSSTLRSITSGANVKLIPVQMPDSQKIYSENGTIRAGDYPFQDTDVGGNIVVKTLLAVGPAFDDTDLSMFLDYVFTHADQYRSYNDKWSELSLGLSMEYMRANPQLCNFKALRYISGYSQLSDSSPEPYFYSEYGISAYHDMATELIWLLSHNLDIDLREKNSTGSWENSYRMLNGNASMALVQDDLFPYLTDNNEIYDSMQAASMKKVAPLHYEYVHLLINTNAANWTSGTPPTNLKELLTDTATGSASQPAIHINVGPKTSGTFITAMKLINSYRTMNTSNADVPDVADMEGMEIYYHFDSPSDAVTKVSHGTYHAMFVVSGTPFHRFYSHDTWSIETDIPNTALIPALFYDKDNDGLTIDNTPYPYAEGVLAGGGSAQYEKYPYSSLILPADIATVRVRAMLVVSPLFNDNNMDIFIKSIFRKSYYKIYPADPDDLDFMPDPLWVPVKKESLSAAAADYDTYNDDVTGAKEYFVKHPFGWTKESAKYYLTMFPDN